MTCQSNSRLRHENYLPHRTPRQHHQTGNSAECTCAPKIAGSKQRATGKSTATRPRSNLFSIPIENKVTGKRVGRTCAAIGKTFGTGYLENTLRPT